MGDGQSIGPELAFGRASSEEVDLVDEVVALVQSAYRGEASRQGWTTEADLLEGQRVDAGMVREVLDRPGSMVLTAHQAGRLVACCELAHRSDADEAYLGMFAVRPGIQGGGIGRLVLAEAERIGSEEWAAVRMVMTVLERRTELIAWYERRGYAATGETGDFPYGDERFGRPKVEGLRFAVLAKPLAPDAKPLAPDAKPLAPDA